MRGYLFFFLLLISGSTLAQLTQPARFEREQKMIDGDFTIMPLEAEGLALIREKDKFKSGNQLYELILLDTALQETGQLELEINNKNNFTGYEYAPGQVHILFTRNSNSVKSELDLFVVDIKTKSVTRYEIKPELMLNLTHFGQVGENFVFGGFVSAEPAIIMFQPASNNIKIVPGFFKKSTDLVDLRINQNETFNTVVSDRSDRENRVLQFKTFDSSGKLLLEDETPLEENMEVQTGITSSLVKEDLIIAGTWGKRNVRQSSGFYAVSVNPFRADKIKTTYFGQLDHYLDYLKPRRAARIKANTQKAIQLGKSPDFGDYVLPFKIVEQEEGFILLAESYLPSRNQNQFQGYDPYLNTYPYPYSYYNSFGYYPTNRVYTPIPTGTNVVAIEEIKSNAGILVAFDGSGNVLWDYSIKFSDSKTSSFNQNSDFLLKNKTLYMVFKNESEVMLKTITLVDKKESTTAEKIRLADSNDDLRSENEEQGVIQYWFGKNFYVWGLQTIHNKTVEDKTRRVFYINKVSVY